MSRTHKTVSISITPELMEQAKAIAIERGFKNSFSAYVAKLIEDDVNEHPASPVGKALASAAAAGEAARSPTSKRAKRA